MFWMVGFWFSVTVFFVVVVCVFIKLRITAQSGHVILVILVFLCCRYSHWSSLEKDQCVRVCVSV